MFSNLVIFYSNFSSFTGIHSLDFDKKSRRPPGGDRSMQMRRQSDRRPHPPEQLMGRYPSPTKDGNLSPTLSSSPVTPSMMESGGLQSIPESPKRSVFAAAGVGQSSHRQHGEISPRASRSNSQKTPSDGHSDGLYHSGQPLLPVAETPSSTHRKSSDDSRTEQRSQPFDEPTSPSQSESTKSAETSPSSSDSHETAGTVRKRTNHMSASTTGNHTPKIGGLAPLKTSTSGSNNGSVTSRKPSTKISNAI